MARRKRKDDPKTEQVSIASEKQVKEDEYEEVTVTAKRVFHKDGIAKQGEKVKMWKPHADIAKERGQVK